MNFKEMMQLDAQQVMFDTNEFANVVSYNDLEIVAIVENQEEQVAGNMFASDGEADRATIYVLVKDIQKPERGDQVTFNGVTWEVVRVASSNAAIHALSCIANEKPGW